MNETSEPLYSDSSVTRRRATVRRTAVYGAVLGITAGALSLVLLSPLLLDQLGRIRGIDWTRLSNIGQTYGAASAILSAVALIGVSLSILVQARQARTERIRIVRERHMDLLRIILDAPNTYGPVISMQARSAVDTQRFLFTTMWMNYSLMGFQMGLISEEVLRADHLAFGGEPMRTWWASARRYWIGVPGQDRKERQFVRIVDEEYRRSVAEGPPIVPDPEGSSSKAVTAEGSRRGGILVCTALGIAIGIGLGSRFRPNRP